MKNNKLVIAVDFDGTCVTHSYPEIGENIGSQVVLKSLVRNGHDLILYTMRSSKELQEAEEWFIFNDIPLYGVQKNPTQCEWTESNKCYAQLYIDDAALGCPLKFSDISDRPYVDWEVISMMLRDGGLITEEDNIENLHSINKLMNYANQHSY